jgi:hypothetical protein
LTINDLPDELLVEIFDFYRQGSEDGYQWWSIKLEWFRLIHVCKRWRVVMFASSSRLDLCFVLSRNEGGNMKTIMSRHFPPLPIDINYKYRGAVKTKDMGRMLAALKRPDRIRGITLSGTAANLDKFFMAATCPFPALESLALRNHYDQLKIPATFLKGSNPHLRSLELHTISLPSTSRLLLSAPALTYLSLGIDNHVGPLPVVSFLLSLLQSMPCLCRLELLTCPSIDDQVQPTEPKNIFTLSKLTRFRYAGFGGFLIALMAGFSAPSLRDIDIGFYSPPVMHFSRFIKGIEEHYHAAQLIVEPMNFRFLFFGCAENDHLPRFNLSSPRQESIMHFSSEFSTKLTTVKELAVILLHTDDDPSGGIIPWRNFLLHFPSVKALRLEGTNNLRIASALHQDHEEPNPAFLPVLEEIELCVGLYSPPQGPSELEVFQPFVSARQRADLLVSVFCGRPWGLSRRKLL